MSMAAAEAAGSSEAGAAAGRSEAGVRAQPRAAQPAKKTSGSTGKSTAPPSSTSRRSRLPSKTKTARTTAKQFTSPSFANYQGVILAEFVLAELLVAGTPFASRKSPSGLSPYVARDMTKMLSLGLVYFLLELSAVGKASWGRYAAWFGGLILIVVGMNEAADVAKVLNIFSPAKKASSAESATAPGESAAENAAVSSAEGGTTLGESAVGSTTNPANQ